MYKTTFLAPPLKRNDHLGQNSKKKQEQPIRKGNGKTNNQSKRRGKAQQPIREEKGKSQQPMTSTYFPS